MAVEVVVHGTYRAVDHEPALWGWSETGPTTVMLLLMLQTLSIQPDPSLVPSPSPKVRCSPEGTHQWRNCRSNNVLNVRLFSKMTLMTQPLKPGE
jgi:hypothetical protein